MKKIFLHPVVQVVLYVGLLLVLIYSSWSVVGGVVPADFNSQVMAQEVMQAFWCLALLVLFSVVFQRRTFASTGIVKEGCFLETVLGFVLGFIVSGGAIFGMYLLGSYHPLSINSDVKLIFPLMLFFFAAIVEEVVFRVFIFQTCEKHWGTTVALIVSSVLFGLAHMINHIQGATLEMQLTGCVYLMFEAGFPMMALFLIRRRIWLPLGLHWSWNFFEGPIFGTIVSGENFGPSLVVAKTTGPFLISGGPFGPEGSIAGLIVGVAFGALASWYAIKCGAWKDRKENESQTVV
ncbi:MAG TPA: CPBP family intramembrane glutamic endopeptidase [Drouetiella sp.]